MATEISLAPRASSMMESMRSVGYTLETALADIIDNSIAAGATVIDVQFRPDGAPYIAIRDNGSGMSADELRGAMRHGSRNPSDARSVSDLGRFGLGLKTASLSQCRELTVVSLKEGHLSACCWDLDVINQRDEWMLLQLSEDEILQLPQISELLLENSGTVVLWRQLDRMLAGESSIEQALGARIDVARAHLALTFHRFLSGSRAVKLRMNGILLPKVDPFMEEHSATQRLDEERFTVEKQTVVVKPFILPHVSKLSAAQRLSAGGAADLRTHQGFYIYRNRRLIISGTWFRLARKDELSKLARVQVDIPNGLDHLWTLDIKKSTAHPPEIVRNHLGRTVDRIADSSRRTFIFRGRRTNLRPVLHGWNRIEGRNYVRYDINRDHPAVKAVLENSDARRRRAVEALLSVLEDSFPSDALYADKSRDIPTGRDEDDDAAIETRLRSLVAEMLASLPEQSPLRGGLITGLPQIEPFSRHPAIARALVMEFSQ